MFGRLLQQIVSWFKALFEVSSTDFTLPHNDSNRAEFWWQHLSLAERKQALTLTGYSDQDFIRIMTRYRWVGFSPMMQQELTKVICNWMKKIQSGWDDQVGIGLEVKNFVVSISRKYLPTIIEIKKWNEYNPAEQVELLRVCATFFWEEFQIENWLE